MASESQIYLFLCCYDFLLMVTSRLFQLSHHSKQKYQTSALSRKHHMIDRWTLCVLGWNENHLGTLWSNRCLTERIESLADQQQQVKQHLSKPSVLSRRDAHSLACSDPSCELPARHTLFLPLAPRVSLPAVNMSLRMDQLHHHHYGAGLWPVWCSSISLNYSHTTCNWSSLSSF